jgi:hypothetical protein
MHELGENIFRNGQGITNKLHAQQAKVVSPIKRLNRNTLYCIDVWCNPQQNGTKPQRDIEQMFMIFNSNHVCLIHPPFNNVTVDINQNGPENFIPQKGYP